jgi:N-acetylglucosaminyl-diphospho-decaprenol L-rhamnosyltransferase
MTKYDDLTIFFVSYYSRNNIEKLVKKINKKIKILIIDNAQENDLKIYFKKKYKNVEVLTCKYNSGQTGGINIGLKKIKTKYAIYMDSDVSFKSNTIDKFLHAAGKIKDFIILAPQHEKSYYKKEFFSDKKSKFSKFNLMKIVHGQFLFFKMKNVKKIGYYDENIFLYFDETDFCLRAYRKNQKIYVIPTIKVKHKGGSSVEIDNLLEIECNKHWHYMWSKFYYYKKNYSLFKAYTKTLFDLCESFLKIFIFFLTDNKKSKINYNKFLGLINSYLGYKSYKRIRM